MLSVLIGERGKVSYIQSKLAGSITRKQYCGCDCITRHLLVPGNGIDTVHV